MRRIGAGAAALAAGMALAGCQTDGGPAIALTTGESGRAAELARLEANRDFRVLAAGPDRLSLMARARPVVVEPMAGLCIGAETVELTEGGVFAAIADCPASAPGPRFAGLVTVSVGPGRLLEPGPGRGRDLRRMRDYLGTVPGRVMLARTAGAEDVRLIEARMIDEGLYVHVREGGGDQASDLFAPDFWRALVEINARFVLVTVSGFAGGGLAPEDMLAALAAQVVRLKTANGQRASADETRIAARAAGQDARDGAGGERTAAVAPADRPGSAPRPAPRPADAAPAARPGRRGAGPTTAPTQAPAAPARPPGAV